MRKPFKAGRFMLADDDSCDRVGWWLGINSPGDNVPRREEFWSDADLRHINRLTAKALKYRHKGKGAK